MAYLAWPYPHFGRGLNLRDKVDAIDPAECIDTLNTVFTERGTVGQRHGYDNFTTSALTNAVGSLHPYYTTGGTKQLLAGCGTRLEGLNSSGGVVASATGLTDGTWDFARFGAPGSELVYAGQGTDTLRKWNGTAWSAPTCTTVASDGTEATSQAMPKAGSLAVMAVDQGNRLVAGRFSGTTGGPGGAASSSNPSRVYFSYPGDPEKWGLNDFQTFTPGDGEGVQAIVAWREFVFVFKKTKFFRVDGSTEDADGNPIFLYTTFDTGIGLAAPKAYAVNERGIYFLAEDGVGHGIYATNGGEPVEVSDAVQPIFAGGSSDFYLGGELNHDQIDNCAMGALDDRIFLAFAAEGSSTNNRVLVYDTNYEWWSLWDIPASCFADFEPSDHSDLMFGYATGSNHVGRYASSFTNDDGTAITSRWRSGWFDFDIPDQKRVREHKIWGSGTVASGLAVDFTRDPGTTTNLILTTVTGDTWEGTTWDGGEWASSSEGLKPKMNRRSNRGTVFSLYLTDVGGAAWTVNRASLHVADQRPPSVLQTDR